MFYLDCVLQSFGFLYLATKWNEIMKFWLQMEKPFLFPPYKPVNLARKIRVIGIIFFVFFLIEHLTFIVMESQHVKLQMISCNFTGKVPFLQVYLYRERPHLLRVVPFAWRIFPIFQFTITCLAFSWNFVDFFIIILAIGLTTRFNQLNIRLVSTPIHQMDNEFWKDIRLHFTNLIDLLDYVNGLIPFLLLLSMSHNIFLVMSKIFEAIK